MTITWTLVFCLPCAVMVLVWAAFLRRYTEELQRFSAWPALLFTTVSAFAGVWGMMHLDELAKRAPFDYGYEGRAWLLGAIGFISALVWVIRSRQWCSWGTLIIAGWMSLVWMAICSTL